MKTVIRIGSRPIDIPQEWPIHNAPRPLYGTKTWQGDFVHGIFYAAIDPADDYAAGWLKENERSDAYELIYLTKEQAVNEAYTYYQTNFPQIVHKIDLDDPDHIGMILRGWINNRNK